MILMKLSLKSVVETRAEVGSNLNAAGDAILIFRHHPRWLLLKCPCSCNDVISLNLDQRAGQSWRIYNGKDDQLSLFPSIWRDSGCLSHFIIRNGHIVMLGERAPLTYRWLSDTALLSLANRVRQFWPQADWVQYVEVADLLGEMPWDVLDACRYLVRIGVLVEGKEQLQSCFRLRKGGVTSKVVSRN